MDGTAAVSVINQGQYLMTSVDIFIDNSFITTLASPFKFQFNPASYDFEPGIHTMRAVGINSIHSKKTTETKFTIIE